MCVTLSICTTFSFVEEQVLDGFMKKEETHRNIVDIATQHF